MPKYTLTYFSSRGNAEVARMMFAYANIDFEDKRIVKEEWPALKPSTPFGQLPTLDVDGVTVCQSTAINRFVAQKCGLMGEGEMENALIDMVCGCVADVCSKVGRTIHVSAETKAELIKTFEEGQLPVYFANLEKMLTSNRGGDGYFVGTKLTGADVAFLQLFDWLTMVGLGALDMTAYPKLQALKERTAAIPTIAAWLEKRPK